MSRSPARMYSAGVGMMVTVSGGAVRTTVSRLPPSSPVGARRWLARKNRRNTDGILPIDNSHPCLVRTTRSDSGIAMLPIAADRHVLVADRQRSRDLVATPEQDRHVAASIEDLLGLGLSSPWIGLRAVAGLVGAVRAEMVGIGSPFGRPIGSLGKQASDVHFCLAAAWHYPPWKTRGPQRIPRASRAMRPTSAMIPSAGPRRN